MFYVDAFDKHKLLMHRINNAGPDSVFLMPTSISMKTRGSSNFIKENDSKFLQFITSTATVGQKTFYQTDLSYTLTTASPNIDANVLRVHRNALPSVIEWPKEPYYTLNGVFLKHPHDWRMDDDQEAEDTNDDFDIQIVTPIKRFDPSKKI